MGQGTTGGTSGAIAPVVVANPDNPNQLLATSTNTDTGRTVYLVRSSNGGASWSSTGVGPPPYSFPPTAQSAGQASMLWIRAPDGSTPVIFAEAAHPFGGSATCDNNAAGIWASSSPDGFGGWSDMGPIDRPGASGNAILSAPRLAYDPSTDKLVAVYERTNYATSDCSGAPTTHEIWMAWSNNDGASWISQRRVGNGLEPAVAAVNGRMVIAYWDGATTVATISCQPILAFTCEAPVPVDMNVADPVAVAGVEAHPQPDIAVSQVAATTRVVVAWSSRIAGASQVRTATSINGGPYSQPAVAVPGPVDQFDARLAAATGTTFGRVDLAFLQDAGSNTVLARATASDTPPAGNGETWSPAITVQANGSNLTATAASSPQGWLGITSTGSAVRLVWTDSHAEVAGDPSDIHGTSLLHGSTAPGLASTSLPLPSDVASIFSLNAVDADGDPLHYSILSGPAHGTAQFQSSVRPTVVYTPDPGYDGRDSFTAQVTDGVYPATATVNLVIGNSPPDIACDPVQTLENQPLPIDLNACVSDLNGDQVHINVLSTQHGSVDLNATTFTPETNFTGSAGITFQAIDTHNAVSQSTLFVHVIANDNQQVTLLPAANRRTVAVGQPVAFNVSPVNDPNGNARKVTWTFSDNASKAYPGPLVTRVWSKPRTITATATIFGMAQRQIQVRVVRPPLQLLLVKVTASRVTVHLRANVAGTLKLSLGKAGSTTKKLKKNQIFPRIWRVGGRPRLRMMMLRAELKPSAKPTLPDGLKLVRAVVLPLR